MTREEVKEILGEEATDVQITNFLNYHHSYEKTKNEEIKSYKAKVEEHNDYDAIKKELDDMKQANMTNEELLVAKQEALDKEIEKTKKEQAKLLKQQNSLEAKSILLDAGINDEEQLKNILNSISTDNKDLTISNATNIANSIKNIKESTEKRIKEELMKGEPNPSSGSGKKADDNGDAMTLEKFNNLTYTEQKEWKDKHGDEEYHKLIEN